MKAISFEDNYAVSVALPLGMIFYQQLLWLITYCTECDIVAAH